MTDYQSTSTIYQKRLRTVSLKIQSAHISECSSNDLKITGPEEVYQILKSLFAKMDDDQEHLILLILNAANKITGYKHISSGGMDGSIVDAKVIFRAALLLGARNIILAHNHPSGSLQPSSDDLIITKKISEGGKLQDIPLLDHIILTHHDYVSLRERNPELFERLS